MSSDQAVSELAEVRLAAADPADSKAVEAAIRLGNAARATMGLMPFAAYYEAAAKGNLLLAHVGDRVVGYALYALARRRVRLSHLCVDSSFRERGVARLLVEQLSNQYADHLGISVRCRHDFGLGQMWPKLGFTRLGERPGRSKAGYAVVDWWHDHGHANLFTADAETVLVRAAVDMNILRDLAEAGRSDGDEAHVLLADHLVGLLELVQTAALNTEIDSVESDLRAACTNQARFFTSAHGDQHRIAELRTELQVVARQTYPNYPSTNQDVLDLQYVAEAIASGLNVFITRDQHLTQVLGPAAEAHGLRIMRPADVVVRIDELVSAELYRPIALLDTAYQMKRVGSGQDSQLRLLTNQAAGEKPQQLIKKLRDLALAGQHRIAVHDPSGKVVAAYSTVKCGLVLRVPLLRVANGPVADTLARQILFHLRKQAYDNGASVILINDACISRQLRFAAFDDGFQETDAGLYGFVIAAIDSALEVEHQATCAARHAGLPEPPSLRSGMPATTAFELERIWWPAKLTDSELPTYLIPIRQAFSVDLLGIPSVILPRDATLGLNREHVYYRSPGGTRPVAPARLLWYMSQSGKTAPHPAAVIACSQLDVVATGTPDEMYSRFRHLGVWTKADVVQAARGGRVQALRFSNTEIFETAIPRRRLRELAQQHGASGQPPQGPVRIPTELFAAIYEEGRHQCQPNEPSCSHSGPASPKPSWTAPRQPRSADAP